MGMSLMYLYLQNICQHTKGFQKWVIISMCTGSNSFCFLRQINKQLAAQKGLRVGLPSDRQHNSLAVTETQLNIWPLSEMANGGTLFWGGEGLYAFGVTLILMGGEQEEGPMKCWSYLGDFSIFWHCQAIDFFVVGLWTAILWRCWPWLTYGDMPKSQSLQRLGVADGFGPNWRKPRGYRFPSPQTGPWGLGWPKPTTVVIANFLHIGCMWMCNGFLSKSTPLIVRIVYACNQTHGHSLQWRHNGHDSVSNHQPHDCLLNRLFRRRSKKASKLRVTGLCVGNSPGTGKFPAQMASNAENISIWWRHHVMQSFNFFVVWSSNRP